MVPASFGEGKGPLARKRCLDATPPGVDREGRVRARVGLRPPPSSRRSGPTRRRPSRPSVAHRAEGARRGSPLLGHAL